MQLLLHSNDAVEIKLNLIVRNNSIYRFRHLLNKRPVQRSALSFQIFMWLLCYRTVPTEINNNTSIKVAADLKCPNNFDNVLPILKATMSISNYLQPPILPVVCLVPLPEAIFRRLSSFSFE